MTGGGCAVFGWAAQCGTPGPGTCSPNARCWRRPVRKTASMARKMRLPVWQNMARQYRGSLSGRRRWRFAARLAGKCPRIGKFHNTTIHPHAAKPRAATFRHTHLRSSILHRGACADLAAPLPHGIIVRSGIYRQNCGKLHGQVVLRFGVCHLPVMRNAVLNDRV